MDDIDRKIINLLSQDSRRALADIGGLVGLSASSVNERIRRLTASGAIRRFTVEVDPAAIGIETLVFVWIGLRDDADESEFRRYIAGVESVQECHHVTGSWSYLMKLRVPAIDAIEAVLADLKARRFIGRSETVIALSSPVPAALIGGRPECRSTSWRRACSLAWPWRRR